MTSRLHLTFGAHCCTKMQETQNHPGSASVMADKRPQLFHPVEARQSRASNLFKHTLLLLNTHFQNHGEGTATSDWPLPASQLGRAQRLSSPASLTQQAAAGQWARGGVIYLQSLNRCSCPDSAEYCHTAPAFPTPPTV